MRNLSTTEMINVNGGTAEKERSTFDTALTTIGGAIAGIGGAIASWFK